MKIDLLVKFAGIDLVNDTIIGVDNVPVTPVAPIQFLVNQTDYECLTEYDGSKVIVFRQELAEPKSLTTSSLGVVVATQFIGGHPTIKPPTR